MKTWTISTAEGFLELNIEHFKIKKPTNIRKISNHTISLNMGGTTILMSPEDWEEILTEIRNQTIINILS